MAFRLDLQEWVPLVARTDFKIVSSARRNGFVPHRCRAHPAKKTVRDGEQPDARSQLGHPSFSATKTRNGSGSKRERAARQHASESVIFPGYKLTAATPRLQIPSIVAGARGK